jgi:hypothetical protein
VSEEQLSGVGGEEPRSEEELRAQLEDELRKITVRDILVQTVVTLVNIGGQRLGTSEATRDVRDLEQTRLAIEAVRGLLPLLEASEEGSEQMRPVRDALAQLQIAYARGVGTGPSEQQGPGDAASQAEEPQAQPGRAQEPPSRPKQSGRLWVPPGSAE